MWVMPNIATKSSRLFALTRLNEFDDFRFPFDVDLVEDGKCPNAPIATWQLKMLIGKEPN